MHRLTTTFSKSPLIGPRGYFLGKATYKTLPEVKPALSNRQKLKLIQPSPELYEKLETLGFGSLLRTKRYAGVNREKEKNRQKQLKYNDQNKPLPDPKFRFPLLSFFAGAKVHTSIPPESLNEVAFVGRSNVGKSSLLNSLAETTVVRTSDKPGLTQQLNFFNVGKLFHMVDMPGYGFAFVDESERAKWRELMETYISNRKTLKRVYVVLDARHGIKVADIDFLKMLDSKRVKFQIVLTKCDLLVLPELARRKTMVENDIKQFRNAVQTVVPVSSKTLAGVNQLRKEILFLMNHLKPKIFYKNIEEQLEEKLQKKNKRKNH